MPRLPRVAQKDALRAFQKAGFALVRTTGSHHVLKKPGHPLRLSIPVHAGKDLHVGILSDLIRDAGLTVEQFIEWLK